MSDLWRVKSSVIQKLRGWKINFNEFSGDVVEGGRKTAKFTEMLKKTKSQSEPASCCSRFTLSLRLRFHGLVARQTLRFIHGHRLRTQSHLCSPGVTPGGGGQQEGSWQTGTSPARTGRQAAWRDLAAEAVYPGLARSPRQSDRTFPWLPVQQRLPERPEREMSRFSRRVFASHTSKTSLC